MVPNAEPQGESPMTPGRFDGQSGCSTTALKSINPSGLRDIIRRTTPTVGAYTDGASS